MRTAALVLAGVGLAFASLPAVAQSTTRIETRPFYGATVTIEEGVRVFRPLPPHDRIIINPDGKTPLSLAFQQTDNPIYTRNYIYNVDATEVSSNGTGAYFPNRYIRRFVPPRPAGGVK
jgi:hypothetical protein